MPHLTFSAALPRAPFVLLALVLTAIAGGGGGAAATRLRPSHWTPATIIPSRMIGVHLDEEIHVARVRVGTPEKELELAVDFSGHTVVIAHIPQGASSAGDVAGSHPADRSTTFVPLAGGGGTDMIRLSGRRYRVPIAFDQGAAARFGCPTCHGIIGVGPGSPLWRVWRDATFSAGAVTFGRALPPVAGAGRVRIACEPLAGDDLCVSEGTVWGATYRVHFQFRSKYTVVPGAVYDRYTGTRNLGKTAVGDWPTLAIEFPSADAPADPRTVSLRIAPESLVGDSQKGGSRTLMLVRNSDPLSDKIILGRTAWRSLMMHREFAKGRATVTTHHTTKRGPYWALISGLVALILLIRWWATRDALFHEASDSQDYYYSAGGIFGRSSAAAAASSPPSKFLGASARLGAGLRSMAMTTATVGARIRESYGAKEGALAYRALARRWGGGAAEREVRHRFPGEWGVYPDRLFVEMVAIPAAIAVLYIPALRRTASSPTMEIWIYAQVLVFSAVAWCLVVWGMRVLGQSAIFGVLPFTPAATRKTAQVPAHPESDEGGDQAPGGKKSTSSSSPPSSSSAAAAAAVATTTTVVSAGRRFLVFRAALVRQGAVDMLLSATLLVLATVTRTDALGSVVMTLFGGILVGVVIYTFMTALLHGTRFHYRFPEAVRGEAVWFFWILYCGLITVLTGVFVTTFVFIPFLQLHVTMARPTSFLFSGAVIYFSALSTAYWLAEREADRMEAWLHRATKVTAGAPHS